MPHKYLLPVVIVISGLLVSGALFYKKVKEPTIVEDSIEKIVFLDPITQKDHILGNPNANLLVVVFSDYDCSFCAFYHKNLEKILDEYGKDGSVALVYRHMPIKDTHPEAVEKSKTAECVAKIHGEEKFWQLTDAFFKNAISAKETLKSISIEYETVSSCVSGDDEVGSLIENQYENAILSGAVGSPYTIFVENGEAVASINRAVSFSELEIIVSSMLDLLPKSL